MPTLTFIIPCFNEEEVLPSTLERLLTAGEAAGVSFEVLAIDDGSTDRTWELIRAAAAAHPQVVRGLRFDGNFGQEPALFAGLAHARGEYVFMLDADLQDPPELAATMLAKAREGFDVVYGVRRSRAGESGFKRSTAWLFHRLLNLVAHHPVPVDSGNFRLLSRRAVDALLAGPDHRRYLRTLVSELPMPQTGVRFDRKPRAAGATKYSTIDLFRVAYHALTSSARKPRAAPADAAPLYRIRETAPASPGRGEAGGSGR